VERDSYDVWESKGKPNLYSNARDLVRQILSSEPKNPLNYNTEKVINEIMDAADRELK
jgi:trimethylamine:corrinoid methyltransferase-like protein